MRAPILARRMIGFGLMGALVRRGDPRAGGAHVPAVHTPRSGWRWSSSGECRSEWERLVAMVAGIGMLDGWRAAGREPVCANE